jgi:sulfur-oxidizing protein SoxZ
MADPMKIRATMQGDVVEVKVLMSHQMETGQRKDAADNVVPAHFIQEVIALHNGKPVMRAQWGTAVSTNPYWGFGFKGAQKGDTITITWVDNKGDRRTDETTVR